jgi:hypothetical protein
MPSFDFSGGILIADIFGLILALPVSLFLAFWMSAVRSKAAVICGALIGGIIGFFIIDGVTATIVKSNPASFSGAATFFGSLIFCTAMAIAGGMVTDLLLGRNPRQYSDGSDFAHE